MELALALVVAFLVCWYFGSKWWRLNQLEAALRRQGVPGPRHSPFLGGIMPETVKIRASFKDKEIDKDNHDILHRILPEFTTFSKQYGVPFFFWWVYEPTLVVNNPEHARELLSKQAALTAKSSDQRRRLNNLLGHGLATVEGEEWAHHRRIVSPAFHFEKLKGMTQAFEECTSKMLDKWQQLSNSEVEVGSEFAMLTGDIIAHTAFGSSYEKGKRVFQIQDTLGKLFPKSLPYDWIPFSRLVPTPHNITIWKLQKEVDSVLLGMIQERKNSVKSGKAQTFGDDLLGLMLAESEKDGSFDNRSLVGECKTFYFAGHATTAALLRWATYLLAINPEWQARARDEVLAVCNDSNGWSTEVLSKLKLVGMILHETLRLYPPAAVMSRCCTKNAQIGDVIIPKGVSVQIPILAIHHDKELWGDDVNEFNPERFSNGVSRASKHPNAFMAFSFGPRICIGQTFALLEAKLTMAMLLKRFSFSLSPSYRHCPVMQLGIRSVHGVQIVLQAL